VVERTELVGAWDAFQAAYRQRVEYWVRHVEETRLGTPYPDVVERVKEVVGWRELAGRATAIVDGTGVGAPVVDMLKRASLGCRIAPVLITGGDLQHREQGYFMVPKRDLMAGLVVRLERGQLKIAEGLKDGEQLMREMAGMRVRVMALGRASTTTWWWRWRWRAGAGARGMRSGMGTELGCAEGGATAGGRGVIGGGRPLRVSFRAATVRPPPGLGPPLPRGRVSPRPPQVPKSPARDHLQRTDDTIRRDPREAIHGSDRARLAGSPRPQCGRTGQCPTRRSSPLRRTQLGGGLFRPCAERLMGFRTADSRQPDGPGPTGARRFDGVAVRDGDNLAGIAGSARVRTGTEHRITRMSAKRDGDEGMQASRDIRAFLLPGEAAPTAPPRVSRTGERRLCPVSGVPTTRPEREPTPSESPFSGAEGGTLPGPS
jgi:hypothetical protein